MGRASRAKRERRCDSRRAIRVLDTSPDRCPRCGGTRFVALYDMYAMVTVDTTLGAVAELVVCNDGAPRKNAFECEECSWPGGFEISHNSTTHRHRGPLGVAVSVLVDAPDDDLLARVAKIGDETTWPTNITIDFGGGGCVDVLQTQPNTREA